MRMMMLFLTLISLVVSFLPAEHVIAQEDLPECNVRDEAEPDKPAWNRETCYTAFVYLIPGPWASPLSECLHSIRSGDSPECPANKSENEAMDIDWISACGCYEADEIECRVVVYIGPDGDCSVVGEGTCKVCARGIQRNNLCSYAERFLDIDFEAPTTAIECDHTGCKPDTEWYSAEVKVSMSCEDGDGSGCAETYYCVDQADGCEPDTVYTEPFRISGEGTHYVRFFSKDIAGNTEATRSETVRVGEAVAETAWHRALVTIAVILLVGIVIYFARRKFVQRKRTS